MVVGAEWNSLQGAGGEGGRYVDVRKGFPAYDGVGVMLGHISKPGPKVLGLL